MDIVTYAVLNGKIRVIDGTNAAAEAAASAEAAAASAAVAESWAIGGTSGRVGEDTNNASYYATQAAGSASLAVIAAGQASFGANVDDNTLQFVEGEANLPVQSDWTESDSSEAAYIANKPAISTGVGTASILEGNASSASGAYSHAEGSGTQATESYAHAEGVGTTASGQNSHAEGSGTSATAENAHAEGGGSRATGSSAHAEGGGSQATGSGAHAEGGSTTASGSASHAEGAATKALGDASHAEGTGGTITVDGSSVNSGAYGNSDHVEGLKTYANGGTGTAAGGAHAEGKLTIANGTGAHAEGDNSSATVAAAHAEGHSATASGYTAHAEGDATTASAYATHTEGYATSASTACAHAEGHATSASGYASHAEGDSTVSAGAYSHAEGLGTIANGNFQHVFGKYNVADEPSASNATYAEIVGNGNNTNSRSNVRTLDWNGNQWLAGNLTLANGKTITIGQRTLTGADLAVLSAQIPYETIGPDYSAEIDCGAALPMQSVVVNIEPVQAGSGDPSPSNIREITGWSGNITVNVSPTNDPLDGTSYIFDYSWYYSGTVYGGTLDLVSGVLTITSSYMKILKYNTWERYGSTNIWYTTGQVSSAKFDNGVSMICDRLKGRESGDGSSVRSSGEIYLSNNSNEKRLYVVDDSASSQTDIRNLTANAIIVFPIATPSVLNLTPMEVTALAGKNVITSPAGKVTATIPVTLKGYVDARIAELRALI